MIKKTISYTDYNGVERTEDFYFNFNEAEIAEMELSVDGGYSEMLKRISEAENYPELMKAFKKFILAAYGEKSSDGKRFEKSEEKSIAFSQTKAYSNLMMEMLTTKGAAEQFANTLIPAEMRERVDDSVKKVGM